MYGPAACPDQWLPEVGTPHTVTSTIRFTSAVLRDLGIVVALMPPCDRFAPTTTPRSRETREPGGGAARVGDRPGSGGNHDQAEQSDLDGERGGRSGRWRRPRPE